MRLTLPSFDPSQQLRFLPESSTKPPLGKSNTTVRLIKNSGDYNVEVRFNQYGLRDDQDIAKGTADDLYVVGDSYAFGWGVEESERFSEVLSTLLQRKVYNLSGPTDIDGYSVLLNYAERLGAKIGTIIVSVNMTNDLAPFRTTSPTTETSTQGQSGDQSVSMLHHLKSFLLEHSAMYFLVTSTVQQVDWLRDLLVKWKLIVPLNRVSAHTASHQAIVDSAIRLAKIAERYNAIFLVIPHRAIWVGDDTDTSRSTHDRFIKELTDRNLRVIDMRTVQEQGGDPMRFHFTNDGHWRASGHALAAEAIAKTLELGPR